MEDLVPTIVITSVDVAPNNEVPQDFSFTVTYTVTAEDKTTKRYVVIVTVQMSDAFDVIYAAGTDANAHRGMCIK